MNLYDVYFFLVLFSILSSLLEFTASLPARIATGSAHWTKYGDAWDDVIYQGRAREDPALQRIYAAWRSRPPPAPRHHPRKPGGYRGQSARHVGEICRWLGRRNAAACTYSVA